MVTLHINIKIMNDLFKKQNEFEGAILAAYKDRKLTAELGPYILWKEGGKRPTHQEVKNMRVQCSTCLEAIWASEQHDDRITEYYDYVEDELLRIDMMYSNNVIS